MSGLYVPHHLLILHQRLLNGDRTASEEIADVLLEPLVSELRSKFPRTDEQVVWDGVIDAVLDLCARPDTFDPNRNVPLDRFLSMAAWRNVANSLRSEKRRRAREEKAAQLQPVPDVELRPPVGNKEQEEKNQQRHQQQQREELMCRLQDPLERKILELRLSGERRTSVFAEALDIQHLPPAKQRREVKRAKDRVDQKLRRLKKK